MRYLFICFVLLYSSCGGSVDPSDLNHLNGYWEIEEVRSQDGQTRTYPASTTIDYIELKGDVGFRKKMQPRLDGTFVTSDDAINFRIAERNGRFYLQYKGGEENWEEELMVLEKDQFSLRNQGGMTYRYKRYQPMEL